jgi:hypothetical protein
VWASVSGLDVMLLSVDGYLYRLQPGGVYFDRTKIADCVTAACRIGRSLIYASFAARDGVGNELAVSVDGGRGWRILSPPSGGHMEAACMLPLASGHVALGGQVVQDANNGLCSSGLSALFLSSDGGIYLSAPPEQAIAGIGAM